MRIVIEIDPGELARGQIAPTMSVAHVEASSATTGQMSDGANTAAVAGQAIDAGPASGEARADHASGANIPSELATQAAVMGATSAGPAPNIG